MVSMVSALINTFWLWVYDKVADVKETSFPNNPAWASGPGSELPKLYVTPFA
jgi:hypothetical protein